MSENIQVIPEQQELEAAIVMYMTKGHCKSITDVNSVIQDNVRNAIIYLSRMEQKMHRNVVRRKENESNWNQWDERCNDMTRWDMERSVSLYIGRTLGCPYSFSHEVSDIQIRLHLKCEATNHFANIENTEFSGIVWIYGKESEKEKHGSKERGIG